MPLVPLPTLLAQAAKGKYGLGYFEAWDSYSLEAVVEAAEAERAPVILGFGCMMVAPTWLDNGGIESFGCIGRVAADRTRVPVSLLLNETRTYQQALRGIDAGFNAVMLDTSALPFNQAVSQVAQLVKTAHPRGVAVEAELGRLPDAVEERIDDTSAELTDPDQAAAFVRATGVDCLAVSIGNVHLLTSGVAPVNIAHLREIHQHTDVPLVMHGGSGFPPEAVQPAIANGVGKFNVGTVLKQVFLDGVREALNSLPARVNVHDVLGSRKKADLMNVGKARMCSKVRELIRLYGGNVRAEEVLGAQRSNSTD
jgi:ketose-bisphosphate aldolase